MADNKRIPEYPKSDSGEFGYSVAKVTLATVPLAGPALQEIMERSIISPLQKRRDNWFQIVASSLEELRNRMDGFDPDKLGENQEFLSVVHHATEIAMRTSKNEKLDLLRNVIKNTAQGLVVEDAMRGKFMSYVEIFSESHIRVLHVLQDPRSQPEVEKALKSVITGGLDSVLKAAVPQFSENRPLMERIYRDLDAEGLISGGLHTTMSGSGLLAKRTTGTGDAFLEFVAD